MNKADAFIRLVRHPVKLRLFLLLKLPSAFFSGVRVQLINKEKTIVTVPYTWFSKNPFKSTYFACLAMAAEMSTGLLAMMHTYKNEPPVSMLVTELRATYHKKATGVTRFICEDGNVIASVIQEALATGAGKTITARSAGFNNAGELVAEFFIEWSFKAKSNV